MKWLLRACPKPESNAMPKPEKQKPEEGQNDRWPGEGLRKTGEEITNAERDEKTTIPEIRPDAKRYNGPSRS